MATVFLVQLFPFRYNFVHWAAGLGISLLYLLAAHRFLSRMFFSERLVLDRQSFTIVRKSLLATRIRRYGWHELGVLHYAGRQHKTDHPLKGSCYDYFGFETQEQLIQNLHHEGNMYFDTADGRIYFAAGVYSWTAEEMVQMMALYIGTGLKLGPEWKEMLQEQEFDDAS